MNALLRHPGMADLSLSVRVTALLVLLMLGTTVAVDTLTGAFEYHLGIDLKLSLLYKMAMLVLMMLVLACLSLQRAVFCLGLLLLLLLTPTVHFLAWPVPALLVEDFGYALKLLSPLWVVMFVTCLIRRAPDAMARVLPWLFAVNAFFLLFNIVVGSLGIGYATYVVDEDTGIGVKGYLAAGNEIGGLFIVLFGFLFHWCWNYRRRWYLPLMLVAMAAAYMIATKAVLLGAVLLAFLTPIYNERVPLWRPTTLKVAMLLPAIAIVVGVVIYASQLLAASGLYDRLAWFYQKNGIVGILLSGRDQFLIDRWQVIGQEYGFFEYLFGGGVQVLRRAGSLFVGVEIDPIDVAFYFGMCGLVIAVLIHGHFLIRAYVRMGASTAYYAPLVALCSTLLWLLACLAGHIWTSGMIGPPLGLLLATLTLDEVSNRVR